LGLLKLWREWLGHELRSLREPVKVWHLVNNKDFHKMVLFRSTNEKICPTNLLGVGAAWPQA